MKSVLIVDEDLGFVVWLGRALFDAGYQALPATTGSDAIARLAHFGATIDLLVVSPEISELAELARYLRLPQRQIPTIAATEGEGPVGPLPADLDLSVSFPKPSVPNTEAQQDWLDLIQNVLARAMRLALRASGRP